MLSQAPASSHPPFPLSQDGVVQQAEEAASLYETNLYGDSVAWAKAELVVPPKQAPAIIALSAILEIFIVLELLS
jgi:hypothetical protein